MCGMNLRDTIAAIRPPDAAAMAAARTRHARLTKPPGSLGSLEELGVRMAGLTGACPPPLPGAAAVAVFAGDHGVHAQGVTPWPQEVTAQMVANFLAGGAVVNAFARQTGTSVVVVDVGVASPLARPPSLPAGAGAGPAAAPTTGDPNAAPTSTAPPAGPAVRADGAGPAGGDGAGSVVRVDEGGDVGRLVGPGRAGWPLPGGAGSVAGWLAGVPRLVEANVRRGTGDLSRVAAMSRDDAVAALDVGIRVAGDLVAAGAGCLLTGDMGIANTTPAAALVAAFTGVPAADATGRGTGIDDATHARKVAIVERALALHRPDPADPIGVLAAVGGLEHAAIAGFVLGAAAHRVPVILDGVIADSAALVAAALVPDAVHAMVAGHRSAEPGATVALRHLGLEPLVDLGMRLGEGTGAVLAWPILASAVRVLHDVATFDSAGVAEK